MRMSINVDLPDKDLHVGRADMSQRSLVGYSGRQFRRFYPIVETLETLCKINEWHWARYTREGKTIAPLYQSGVYYKAEPLADEEWNDVVHIYRQGFGDCEDLACARIGELRFAGIPAVPAIQFKKVNTERSGVISLVHVLVLWPDGSIEDPSKVLGMKGEYR